MKAAGRSEGEWKRVELQLDTAQILLVIAMLLGLCAASFYLGCWIERDRWQVISGRTSPPKNGTITDTDVAADLTFFDKLGSQSAEPAREARPTASTPPDPKGAPSESETAEGTVEGDPRTDGGDPDRSSSASSDLPSPSRSLPPSASSSPGSASNTTPPLPASGGAWAVQVFAGDRSQAEKIAATLANKGYATRVVPGSAGSRSARVRVIGYRSRVEAQQGAKRLRRESNLKPWVVKPD